VDSEGSLLSFDGCVLERSPTPSPEEAASRILESALLLLERKMPGWKLKLELVRSHYKGTSSEPKAIQLLEEHGGA
jgi:hypothetical protein